MPGLMSTKIPTRVPLPLPHLFFVFGQRRKCALRELIRYFADAACIRAHHWIGEKHVRGAARQATSSSSVVAHLKFRTPRSEQHAQRVGQLWRS